MIETRPFKGSRLKKTLDNYIVIDIETTGFSPQSNEIIEVALLIVKDSKVIKEYQQLLKPKEKITKKITALTGITNDMVKDQPSFSDIAEDLIELINTHVLVGHNVDFDICFLYDHLLKTKNYHLRNNYIDTMHLSINLFKHLDSYSLECICRYLNIPFKNEHRALSDCKATYHCYEQQKMALSGNKISQGVKKSSSHCKENTYSRLTSKADSDKAMHTLEGILKGMAYDSKINDFEIKELVHWIGSYAEFRHIYPFKDVFEKIDEILEDNVITEVERDDLLWFCNQVTTDSQYYDLVTSDLQRLKGILYGIISDKVINGSEIIALNKWIQDNKHLDTTYPYSEITSILYSILEDGLITNHEKQILERYIFEFIDEEEISNYSVDEIENIKKSITISGICAYQPKLVFKNRNFTITGNSQRFSKKQLKKIIEDAGGLVNKKILEDTDYLLVCDEINPYWVYSCYGRKIDEAMTLRQEGHKIIIVHEQDFLDCLL